MSAICAEQVLAGLAISALLAMFMPLAAMVVPFAFWRRRTDEGIRMRRRRVRASLIALAMTPLMAVGPETVHALHVQQVQALLQAAMAAAV